MNCLTGNCLTGGYGRFCKCQSNKKPQLAGNDKTDFGKVDCKNSDEQVDMTKTVNRLVCNLWGRITIDCDQVDNTTYGGTCSCKNGQIYFLSYPNDSTITSQEILNSNIASRCRNSEGDSRVAEFNPTSYSVIDYFVYN